MAVWRPWFRDVLLDGRRWFAINLPGAGGLIPRVVKYREVTEQLLGGGNYSVMATFEQRGRAAAPQVIDPPALDPLTLLQSRYIGANPDDESYYQRGAPTVSGAIVTNSGVLVIDRSTSDPAQYHEYPTFAPDGVRAVTFELLLEYVTHPNVAYTPACELLTNTLDVLNSWHRFGFYDSSWQHIYDTVAPGPDYLGAGIAGVVHCAVVYSATGRRAYINGQKVAESLGDNTLGPNLMRVRMGDWQGYTGGGRTAFNIHGFRVRQEEVYVGDSFTPPTEIPSPYL
jgi:hypothetical protein